MVRVVVVALGGGVDVGEGLLVSWAVVVLFEVLLFVGLDLGLASSLLAPHWRAGREELSVARQTHTLTQCVFRIPVLFEQRIHAFRCAATWSGSERLPPLPPVSSIKTPLPPRYACSYVCFWIAEPREGRMRDDVLVCRHLCMYVFVRRDTYLTGPEAGQGLLTQPCVSTFGWFCCARCVLQAQVGRAV